MTKTIKYNGFKITIDIENLTASINDQSAKYQRNCIIKKINRRYFLWYGIDGKSHMAPLARLICLAVNPIRNYKHLQVDHIDDNTLNDQPENLQWVTRKQNNSKKHAVEMKSIHAKKISHKTQLIKATKGNIVRFFTSGHKAAKEIGCSWPLVYMALSENSPKHLAKKWHLEWVDKNEVEA